MPAFATGEVVTVSGASIGLTAATYVHAISAFIEVQAQPIRWRAERWRADGTAPTSTVGFKAIDGTLIELKIYQEIANLRAISDGGASGDATLQVHYRK